ERGNLWRYVKRAGATSAERALASSADAAPALIGLAWSSTAALAIAPLQDLLNLGKEARMNRPGTADSNWRWRAHEAMLSPSAFQSLRDVTHANARASEMEMADTSAAMAVES